MNQTSHIETGKRVVDQEAASLEKLRETIGEDFSQAVDLILSAKGRLIISGMGKSGHIARKIAATFASTGTPAHFVHPAEASHGDLGMLAKGDVALVLSNSGETPELVDVVAHTRRFQIPLIGVASNPDSSLIKQSDVALILPKTTEACRTGIVPTVSTTMTLALGDALAIALMEHRDFTPENFREFHPGGKLGSHLTKVRDLMHLANDVPLTSASSDMSETLREISAKGFGIVGIIDNNAHLSGVITDGDLRRNLDGLMEMRADDIMTKSPRTVAPTALAEEAVAIMNEKQITCLFVVDPSDNKVAGILHIHDCLRAGIG